MKLTAALVLGAAFLVAAGCANLDLARESDPSRVVTGTVTFPGTLPAGAQVLVRVVQQSTFVRPTTQELPLAVADRAKTTPVERVLGEQIQTLTATASQTVPFRIEYQADDMTLRQGLNIDARISYDGKVRFRTVSAHALSLGSAQHSHEVEVQSVQ